MSIFALRPRIFGTSLSLISRCSGIRRGREGLAEDGQGLVAVRLLRFRNEPFEELAAFGDFLFRPRQSLVPTNR